MSRFDFDDIELSYELRKGGEPVVLVHASPFVSWYRPLVAQLSHFSTLSYRRRLRSPDGATFRTFRPLTVAEDAAICARLMDHVGWTAAHIVGHSYGCLVALQLAIDQPQRVASVALLESLDRSRAEQQRLVQDAGHELRTPLTSLRTNLDVLRRHPNLEADDRGQIVDDLHAEVEEMVILVDEIVTVASGVAADEARADFSLGEATRRVVDRFARRTGRRFDVITDESPVNAQETAVERAVANLLDNAAKFDRSAAPIRVEVAGGGVSVMDRGPGIPVDELAHVFERFHRTAATQSLPGSGLGLSIVRDVVTRNGGSVHVANREGGGAVIGFRLPPCV